MFVGIGRALFARYRCHLLFKGAHDRFGIPVNDGQLPA